MTEYRITVGSIDVEAESEDEAIIAALDLLRSLAQRAMWGADDIAVSVRTGGRSRPREWRHRDPGTATPSRRTSVACRYGRHAECVGGADYGREGFEGKRYGPCGCPHHTAEATP